MMQPYRLSLILAEEIAEYVLDDKRFKELPKDFYATRSYADFLNRGLFVW